MTVSDIDYITYGQAVDILCACRDNRLRANGLEIADDRQRYRYLKSIEPQIDESYKNGEIDEKQYQSYKQSLRRWENG